MILDHAKTAQRLLIVEDDAPSRFALGRILMASGYDVSLADSLAAARDKWHGQQWVLLDLHLPDGSGLDLLATLKAGDFPSSHVAICSAALESEIKSVLHKHGPIPVFRKPINIDAVLTWLGSDPGKKV